MSGLGIAEKMKSTDEIFGLDELNKQNIVPIEIKYLIEFSDHPFRVVDENEFNDLVNSVKVNGIIEPIIVREKGNRYEMLTGHQRTQAAIKIGMDSVPAIIKNVDDNMAKMIVIDTNFKRRQNIVPSDKARAYLMRNEILSAQGKRTDLKDEERHRWQEVAKSELGDSATQINRYIRLNYLIDELLNMVDNNALPLTTAYCLSYLNNEHQKAVHTLVRTEGVKITQAQANELKEKKDTLDIDYIMELLTAKKPVKRKKISIPYKQLQQYFPDSLSEKDIVNALLEMLKTHKIQL